MISTFKNFNQPKRVMIPVKDIKTTLKVDDAVKIGSTLDSHGNIYATVSGTVKQIIEHLTMDNQPMTHVIIENNQRNTVATSVKKMHESTRIEKFFKPVHNIEQIHFTGMDTLIVDLIYYDEPFVTIDKKFLEDHIGGIQNALSRLYDHYNFKNCFILVKDEDDITFDEATDFPYQMIAIKPEKHVDFRYKMINKTFHNALMKNQPYNYLMVESILKLDEIITHERPPVNNRFVIQGEVIQHPTVLFVRVGTIFSDIKRIFGGYTTELPITMHKNMRIENTVVKNEAFAITDDLAGIYVQEHREREIYECIACGRCNTKCPAGILPSKIMHAVEHEIYLERMRTDLCIECGLCSFYCPSKIPVMGFVKKAKTRLKEGQ